MMDKSILEVVHESAKDYHASGVIDDMTMRKFDSLCLTPVKEFKPSDIKRLREKSKASQGVFAAYLNISISTVQKWEQGKKEPNGTALKLLNLIADKGLQILG